MSIIHAEHRRISRVDIFKLREKEEAHLATKRSREY